MLALMGALWTDELLVAVPIVFGPDAVLKQQFGKHRHLRLPLPAPSMASSSPPACKPRSTPPGLTR